MISAIYITLINVILIFIAFLILYNRINKKSAPSIVEEYTREVERLIVELNRAVDDVLNISEERIQELKKLIRKAERLLKKPEVKDLVSRLPDEKGPEKQNEGEKSVESASETIAVSDGVENKSTGDNDKRDLIAKTRHLVSMGYSRDEIGRILGINRAEVELLLSLYR